jgi:hypothetical protein
VKAKWLKGREAYEGSQLGSLWAFREQGVQGDSILGFRGPCEVSVERLVDLEDAKKGAFIYSSDMLHFIAEHFELDLEAAILRQYLLVGIAQDELNSRQKKHKVRRSGNDLYAGPAKLSVSIATLTPVSSKIHFGINVSSKGTPVRTMGLAEMGIQPAPFAQALLKRYVDDHARMAGARTKVRGVS